MIAAKIKTGLFLGAMALGASSLVAQDGGVVVSPAKRHDTLEKGRKLLATRESSASKADPFHSERFVEIVSGVSRTAGPNLAITPAVPAPRSEQEILQKIAASLKPTGNFIMGGEPTLVFGQKRVKAGGLLTITFEGTEYTLEITAIERTSFTLRLNREVFTRPIK